jgi:hypothetical protein
LELGALKRSYPVLLSRRSQPDHLPPKRLNLTIAYSQLAAK